MWNNSQWEQENQELLKEWYLDKVTGKDPNSAVRVCSIGAGQSLNQSIRLLFAHHLLYRYYVDRFYNCKCTQEHTDWKQHKTHSRSCQ